MFVLFIIEPIHEHHIVSTLTTVSENRQDALSDFLALTSIASPHFDLFISEELRS